ncbi:hypothetical protein PHYBOEH_009654 [Phytophthora boehmeriae]|uniref:Uncharacterized protein n=1 Tax=Phytophthora boehmeriae TaxID=109152 RepID=A0A8T1VS88_9STRA|nr:hypothetical protein PHYBOEH_009654 [Phytophthora boehmeriae]
MTAAKSPEVVDGMIDDSLLGILVILLVVMLSTGYVYVQQLQQGDGQQAAAGAQLARRAPSTAAALGSSSQQAAISTNGLSDRQLKLHYTLPMRNGARTVTISAEALLETDDVDALKWTHEDVPTLLADLSRVADVYLLCTVKGAKDTESMQRIREFVSTHPDLKSNDTTPGGIKTHKILFCTTAIGKIAFVRQIEPHIHVEVDAGVVHDLEKHVPRVVHISATPVDAAASSAPNVVHELWDHKSLLAVPVLLSVALIADPCKSTKPFGELHTSDTMAGASRNYPFIKSFSGDDQMHLMIVTQAAHVFRDEQACSILCGE